MKSSCFIVDIEGDIARYWPITFLREKFSTSGTAGSRPAPRNRLAELLLWAYIQLSSSTEYGGFMAFIEWSMQGTQVSHCNCNIGCPCQFNALPTHGNCRAYVFVQIDKGHFGETTLDGLRWGGIFEWPGPIHLGNGTAMIIVDKNADADQKAAIEAVASGKETDPGSLITQVFSTTLSKVLPTQVKLIELSIDYKGRTAQVRVPDLVEGSAESIKNPITGQPHRVSVKIPKGFEYDEAEFLIGKARASGPIELHFNETHAHIARLHWGTHGVVR